MGANWYLRVKVDFVERKVPYEGLEGHLVITAVLKGQYLEVEDTRCPQILRSLLAEIFVTEPKNRPSFADIVKKLEEVYPYLVM